MVRRHTSYWINVAGEDEFEMDETVIGEFDEMLEKGSYEKE